MPSVSGKDLEAAKSEQKKAEKVAKEQAKAKTGAPKPEINYLDSYLVDATIEVNKPGECDAGICSKVKHSALQELSEGLKAKLQVREEEAEEIKKDL